MVKPLSKAWIDDGPRVDTTAPTHTHVDHAYLPLFASPEHRQLPTGLMAQRNPALLLRRNTPPEPRSAQTLLLWWAFVLSLQATSLLVDALLFAERMPCLNCKLISSGEIFSYLVTEPSDPLALGVKLGCDCSRRGVCRANVSADRACMTAATALYSGGDTQIKFDDTRGGRLFY